MTETRTTNPMRGPNKFKLGVVSANCDGGLTMSLSPERWAATRETNRTVRRHGKELLDLVILFCCYSDPELDRRLDAGKSVRREQAIMSGFNLHCQFVL
jgi:hypothetical protein